MLIACIAYNQGKEQVEAVHKNPGELFCAYLEHWDAIRTLEDSVRGWWSDESGFLVAVVCSMYYL